MTQKDTPSLTVTTDELARTLYEAWNRECRTVYGTLSPDWVSATMRSRQVWRAVAREAARVILDKAPGVEVEKG